MSGSMFSPSWYRVAKLKPRLRSHVEIHRHSYRGEVWFVLEDHATARSHRLHPAAWRFIGLMNGTRTVEEIWELANAASVEEAPGQEDIIRLLGQLRAADAMICDVPRDTGELLRRFERQDWLRLRQKIWSPMAIRLPLINPDWFLDRTIFLVRPLFTVWGGIAWLILIAVGL